MPAMYKHSSLFSLIINEIENFQSNYYNQANFFPALLANIGIGTNALAYFGSLSVIKNVSDRVLLVG